MSGAAAVASAKPNELFGGTIEPASAATLITALELFVPAASTAKVVAAPASDSKVAAPTATAPAASSSSADGSDAAKWVLTAANPLELQFFEASYKRLVELFKAKPIEWTIDSDAAAPVVRLMHPSGKGNAVPVTTDEVTKLLGELRAYLAVPGRFDYHDIVKRVTAATMKVITDWMRAGADVKDTADTATYTSATPPTKDVTSAVDMKVLATGINPQPIEFSGGEMASFEIDFQAGFRVLMYPDVNKFHPEHLALVNGQKRGNAYNAYYWDALCFPEHELQHCIQMELKQQDATGWSLEHDASRVALVATAYVAQLESAERAAAATATATATAATAGRPLFPAGTVEEIALYISKLCTHTITKDETYTAAHASGYTEWRDSYGIKSPVPGVDSFTFVQQNQNVTDLFKYRVSLEAYLHARAIAGNSIAKWKDATHDLLAVNYNGRVNTNLLAKAVTVPKTAVLSSAVCGLDTVLATRMNSDETVKYIRSISAAKPEINL